MPLSSYRPGLKVITYFTPTEIKRGSPLHFEGWTGTNLCVQGLPLTLVRKPHLEVTPSLWLWGNQGRDVVFWGLLNKIVLAKIFRSCLSGWNLVRGFGWIIGNWVIRVFPPPPFMFSNPRCCFHRNLSSGTRYHSNKCIPHGRALLVWRSLKYYTVIILRSQKMHLALMSVIPFTDFAYHWTAILLSAISKSVMFVFPITLSKVPVTNWVQSKSLWNEYHSSPCWQINRSTRIQTPDPVFWKLR